MDKIELKKTIRVIHQKIFENISNINNGGCGVFAYILFKVLKNLGMNPKLPFYENRKPAINKDKFYIEVNNKNYKNCELLSPAHTMVQVDDLFIDGEQMGTFEEVNWFNEIDGYYSEEELKCALKYGGWSDYYDQSQDGELKRIIYKAFEKYLNSENNCNKNQIDSVTKL